MAKIGENPKSKLHDLLLMNTVKRKMDGSTAAPPVNVVDPFTGLRNEEAPKSRDFRNLFNGTAPAAGFSSELCFLVVIWYSCAIVTITTTKEVMNRVQFPFTLCFSQFAFATVLSLAYLKCSNKYKMVPPEASQRVLQISATYTFGFVLTNIAFSQGILLFESLSVCLFLTSLLRSHFPIE